MRNDMLSLAANAKINWFLDITGRRQDGYHTLSTLMQKISLADDLYLAFTNDKLREILGSTPFAHVDTLRVTFPSLTLQLSLDSIQKLVLDENNTIIKAVRLFLDACDGAGIVFPYSELYLHLVKRIPVQGGLGGGSADAAAVLRILNSLLEAENKALTELDLAAVALQIGADVPFCLHRAPLGYCTGIGEIIEAVEIPQKDYSLMLFLPGLQVSTALAFGHYDSMTREQREAIPRSDSEAFLDALREADFATLCKNGVNGFTYLMADLHPELLEIRSQLLESGAVYAAMSGSGPTFFAVYESDLARERGEQLFAEYLRSRDWQGYSTVMCKLIG